MVNYTSIIFSYLQMPFDFTGVEINQTLIFASRSNTTCTFKAVRSQNKLN